MIAKIISHGTNRNESIRNLQRYLGELEIAGIITNLNLLKKLLNNKNFKEANLDTKFVENNIKKLTEDSPQISHIALAGLIIFKNLIKNENNYWSMWRPSQYPIKLIINNTIFSLNFIYSTLDNIEVHFDDLKFKFYSVKIDDSHILTKLNGKDEKVTYNSFTEKNLGNQIFTIFTKENTFEAQVFNSMIFEENQKEVSQDNVLSPMHGVIKFKNIKKGLHVKKGEVLMLLEAMKMEYSLTCPRNGIIEEIHVKDGQQAGEGMELLTLKKDLNDG